MLASPELPVTLQVAPVDIGTGCTEHGAPRDHPPTAKSSDMGAKGDARSEAGLQTSIDANREQESPSCVGPGAAGELYTAD